jgi:predicted MFS family arabinose efflux permease
VVSVRTLLAGRSFRIFLASQALAGWGSWLATVAFMAVVFELTGSPTAVGGILALRLLPAAVGGPLAARIAWHWDRRRTLLTMDAARAVMLALVPWVAALWWIYIWAFLLELATMIFLPPRDAVLPRLVRDDDLPLADGLLLASSYGTIPLGAVGFAATAAALPDLLGRPHLLPFLIASGTFAASFSLLASLAELESPPGQLKDGTRPTRFRAAFRIPMVRAVLPAVAATALGLGALFSLGIVFVTEVLGASDAQFGVLVSLFGVGAALGLSLLQRVRVGSGLARTRSGVVAMGAVVAGFSFAPGIAIACLGATGFGAAVSYSLASGMGVLQTELGESERVLAFTAFHVSIRLCLALASLGAGVAGDLLTDVHWPLVGRLEPARVILLVSGLVVCAAGTLIHRPGHAAGGHRSGEPGEDGGHGGEHHGRGVR